MSTEVVQVDDRHALIALAQFRMGIRENEELLRELGAAMYVSVRRTFRDQGSPEGSWAPLALSTIRSNPRVYGPGHKLLILSGRLLNSITYRVMTGAVEIGSNLVYAAVQNFGSRDRSFGIGPRTAEQEAERVKVPEHMRLQSKIAGYRQYVERASLSRKVEGPAAEGRRAPRIRVIGPANLHRQAVKRIGPLHQVRVRAHERHQNIPARPFAVFRPEDPERLRGITVRYVNARAQQAGLELGEAFADAGLGSAI